MRGQRRQGHVRVRVQPALVVQVLELGEPRAVALQELRVHRLKLDQNLGQECFLGQEGEVLPGDLVVVADQVVDRRGGIRVRGVDAAS